jgi:CRP-like cAMP-binding protein
MYTQKIEAFDPYSFLRSIGPGRSILQLKPGQIVFRQGDPANALYYVQEEGRVQVSIISDQGKEGVTAIHGPSEFFGQEALIRECTYRTNAIATGPTIVAKIDSEAMMRAMEAEPALAIMFISFVLSRNLQIEDDLIDHLFNSSEKRLARLLLKLAGFEHDGTAQAKTAGLIPKMSQEVLASKIGTTRGRINYFMNKFRKLGYIDYHGEITVRATLANIILDGTAAESDDLIGRHKVTPVSVTARRGIAAASGKSPAPASIRTRHPLWRATSVHLKRSGMA